MDTATGRFHQEGELLKLINPNTKVVEYVEVVARERARFNHLWSEYISPGSESGPEEISKIEPAKDKRELYQGVFSPRERVYLYISLPANIRIGGVPLYPKSNSTNRLVGYIDNQISPYRNPGFQTEFFLRGSTNINLLNLDAFNPTGVTLMPRVEFEINKMLVETIEDQNIIQKIKTKCLYARPVTLGGLPSTRGEVMKK